jgi:hypothetical protein
VPLQIETTVRRAAPRAIGHPSRFPLHLQIITTLGTTLPALLLGGLHFLTAFTSFFIRSLLDHFLFFFSFSLLYLL